MTITTDTTTLPPLTEAMTAQGMEMAERMTGVPVRRAA